MLGAIKVCDFVGVCIFVGGEGGKKFFHRNTFSFLHVLHTDINFPYKKNVLLI